MKKLTLFIAAFLLSFVSAFSLTSSSGTSQTHQTNNASQPLTHPQNNSGMVQSYNYGHVCIPGSDGKCK